MKNRILTIILFISLFFNEKVSFSQTWTKYFANINFNSIVVDKNNNIWAGAGSGLYKYNGSTWINYNINNSPFPTAGGGQITALFIDAQSYLWIGFKNNALIKYDMNNTWKTILEGSFSNGSDIAAINQDYNGTMWIATYSSGIKRFDGVNWSSPIPSNYHASFSVEIDKQNNVWIANLNGSLIKYSYDSILTNYSNFSNDFRTIENGVNNDLWIGTNADGVYLFDKDTTITHHDMGMLGTYETNDIVVDNDSIVWVTNEILRKYQNGVWTEYNTMILLNNMNFLNALAIDYNGDLWIGADNGLGKYSNNGAGPILELNIAPNDYLCSNDSIILKPNIPGNYLWQDSSTNDSFTVREEGLYWLTVNYNGREYVDSIYIRQYPLYNLADTFNVCLGDSFIFHDGTVANNITTTITHNNYFQSINGCDSTVTTTVNVTIIDTSITVVGNFISSNSTSSSYQWLDCDNSSSLIPFETSKNFVANYTGNYSVMITKNGCIDTSSCYTVFESCYQNNLNKVTKIVPSIRQNYQNFGGSIATDIDQVIVGSPGQYPAPSTAYIIKKNNTGLWNINQKLNFTLPGSFGNDVSISGDYAVVGSFSGNTMTGGGAAYIFKRDSLGIWNQLQKITSSDNQLADDFGLSVSIKNNTIAVSAPRQDYDETGNNWIPDAGAIYLFELDTLSGLWQETQKIVSSNRHQSSNFGSKIIVDNETIIVGAQMNRMNEFETDSLLDAGAVYIIKKNGINWVQTQKIVAHDRAKLDYFGHSLALDNTNLVIGAYQEDDNLAGTDSLNSAGSAYIFKLDTQTGIWSESQKLIASDRDAEYYFGASVAIKDNKILIGASNPSMYTKCAIYLFEQSGGIWVEQQSIQKSLPNDDTGFGSSVCLQDNYAFAGAANARLDKFENNAFTNSGAIYVYKLCEPCLSISSFSSYADSTNQYGLIVVNNSSGNIASYFWDFGDGNSSNQPYPQHTYNQLGTYNICLTVTDINGCATTYCDTNSVHKSIGTLTINVIPPIVTSADNSIHNLEYLIRIYPNPTSTELNIDTELEISEITIIDITGKIILTAKQNTKVVNVADLSNGIYFIKLFTGEKIITRKFVKQ